jgi:hypothetical protein
MRRIVPLYIASSTSILCACAPTPEIIGRFEHATCRDGDGPATSCRDRIVEPEVSVTLEPPGPSPDKSRGGVDLTNDRAQSNYISVMGKFSTTADEFRTNLAAPIAPASEAGVKDIRAIGGKIVVTLTPKPLTLAPGDRLDYVTVVIKPINLNLVAWSVAPTVYFTPNLGSETLVQQRGAKVGATFPLPPANLTAEISSQSTRTEAKSYTPQVMLLTPIVGSDGTIRFDREGAEGMQLFGNFKFDVAWLPVAALTAAYDVFSAKAYADKEGEPLEPSKIELKMQRTLAPRGLGNLEAMVQVIYKVRHILSGAETLTEADDNIELIDDSTDEEKVVLAFDQRFHRPVYGLGTSQHPTLYVRPKGYPTALPMCFASFEEAEKLLRYLGVRFSSRIGSADIGFTVPPEADFEKLTPAQANQLKVLPNCQP